MDVGKTLNTALTRHVQGHQVGKGINLQEQDLHLQIHSQRPRRLIVFAIDTSDSMGEGPTSRMSAALGAIISLASRAYLNRDLVSLITFREHDATLVVPPTSSVLRIRRQLTRLPVGGATPLAAGLLKARQVISQATCKDSSISPLLVLISDGDATTPSNSGAKPADEALRIATQLGGEEISALAIDTVSPHLQKGDMNRLAKALGCSCHQIHKLQASDVLELIEES